MISPRKIEFEYNKGIKVSDTTASEIKLEKSTDRNITGA